MFEQPLVSVGLPCYNRPESLRRSIECILNQTYKNIEFIISNDASPNPLIKPMLDEFAMKDNRIRLFHQKTDLKCYGNYFFVQQQATGKYFMYMQDDDIWEPDAIELMVGNLERNPENAVVLARSQYIDEQGKMWQEFRFDNQNLITFIFGEKAPFVWMGLWRTELLQLFDWTEAETHGKDIIVGTEALLSYPFGYVDKLLYYKTLYHDKALQYVTDKPFCHFELYGTMLYRIAVSKHVKHKSWLIILVPAACLGIVRMYLAAALFTLPLDHWFRRYVRKVMRG